MVSLLRSMKPMALNRLRHLNSRGCGMFYCRIIELAEHTGPQIHSTDREDIQNLVPPEQGTRKRKLTHLTPERQLGPRVAEGDETDFEDEIHQFRRIHIRPRHGIYWSPINKHPSMVLLKHGIELSFVNNAGQVPNTQRVVAAYATKPFNSTFNYFEVEILSKVDLASVEGNT